MKNENNEIEGNIYKEPMDRIGQFAADMAVINQRLLDFWYFPGGNKEGLSEKINLLKNALEEYHIRTEKSRLILFLKIISNIRRPTKVLIKRTKKLLILMMNDIGTKLNKKEIFDIFHEGNAVCLLALYEINLIDIETVTNGMRFLNLNSKKDREIFRFFCPEIRKHDIDFYESTINKDKFGHFEYLMEEYEKNPEMFYENRKAGKHSSYVYRCIQEDNIDHFISFVEFNNIDLNNQIREDNLLYDMILDDGFTPIEYAAFHGAIKIFKYLCLNKVDMSYINCDILAYAIAGRNYEIIHILEENEYIKSKIYELKIQKKCMESAIIWHHNEIYDYLSSTYHFTVRNEYKLIFRSFNFELLEQKIQENQEDFYNIDTIHQMLYCFCQIGYEDIVIFLINLPYIDINKKIYVINQLIK